MVLGLKSTHEFLRRIGNDLGQGRMIVRDAQEIVHGSTIVHDGCHFMNEFTRLWSDDLGPKDLAASRLAEQPDESMGLAGTEGFAMVGKRVGSRKVRNAQPAALCFI